MFHVKWNDGPYEVAILIKHQSLKARELAQHYLKDIPDDNVIGFSLDYGGKKKPSATTAHAYIANLLPALDSLGITTLYCVDGEYFKKLTKKTKAEPNLGYVLPCAVEGFTHMNVVYGINYSSLIYDTKNEEKLALSLRTLKSHLDGKYKEIGTDIIHEAHYPQDTSDIEEWLTKLLTYPVLTADFEAFSLEFIKAGIGSVGFAWDKHSGVSFCCDYIHAKSLSRVKTLIDIDTKDTDEVFFGEQIVNHRVRGLLKKFFTEYEGKLIWHNANYDLKIAVYSLWMDNPLDYEGMLEGIEVMTKHFEDTKLLTYLATNSCAGNKLSLKDQAHAFAGNYAQEDINDIRMIPKDKLLEYNLVDCLATWYVYGKHSPTVDEDSQRDIYDTLFIPAVKQILQMELVGMPLHMPAVIKANTRLTRLQSAYSSFLQLKLEKIGYLDIKRNEAVHEYNTTRKRARKTLGDFEDMGLNSGSPKQLQHLLYETWGLPVLDYTDTKQPATGTKTLGKLLNHAKNNDQKMVIRCLVHLSKVGKIISSFMPNFLGAVPVSDGSHRLYGGFNLGGTVSGRLSSSKPNLQQIDFVWLSRNT